MAKTPIRPRTWHPPKDVGLKGPFAPNTALAGVDVIPLPGTGAEDVAVDGQGRIYTGTREGYILRISADGRHVERLVQTGGRPLGIEVHPDGSLIVCDAHRGLLRLDPDTLQLDVLASEVNGVPMRITNNCAIARDGSVYFSDSSQDFGLDEFKGDIIAHTGSGRLLRWQPDGTVEVLLEGLNFANGVALAGDESFVLVAETSGYSVVRLDLTGPSAGRRSLIIENLPGLPDNMSTGSNGVFWIAMPSVRNKLLDFLLPKPGFLRSAIWAMPDKLQPDASRITWVIGIDGEGTVVRNLQGPGTAYHYVTGVREHEGKLYLGSLVEPGIAVVALPR
ncbi:MAG: SMP-30/gluconolactonase/LRE family protein [Ilumatobacteraceae bacterium]